MHWVLVFLLAAPLLFQPQQAGAQAAADTLPERVVAQLYDAWNRCDAQATFSLFAPVWYYSVLEDSAKIATRRTRTEALRKLDPEIWTSCGDSPSPRLKMVRRIVLGPYVVDEQAAFARDSTRITHLDIFEVRGGKIVHEWESDAYTVWRQPPP